MSTTPWVAYVSAAACSILVGTVAFVAASAAGVDVPWPAAFALIVVASLISTGLIVYEGLRHVAQPVDDLAQGMRRVATGDFDVRLDVDPRNLASDVATGFNQMAESLQGVEALRETFVSNVSHEFKTPLSYIQGYATLLRDDDLTAAEREEYAQNVLNATRRMSDMIANLLEISNLSRPGAQVEMERFSLDEQLRHAVAIFVPQLERKGIGFEVDLDDVNVVGNQSLLEDVWVNLLSNAVKYTQAGGRVSVSLTAQQHHATVAVADTGCGMTEDQAAHAFDRFYQGDTSHAEEGNGLGLAIVKTVVKKHHGTLSLKSAPDQGTTIAVILPLDG